MADVAWSTEGFAYADGHNGERYIGLRAGEQLLSVAPSGLIVHPEAANRQFDKGTARSAVGRRQRRLDIGEAGDDKQRDFDS